MLVSDCTRRLPLALAGEPASHTRYDRYCISLESGPKRVMVIPFLKGHRTALFALCSADEGY